MTALFNNIVVTAIASGIYNFIELGRALAHLFGRNYFDICTLLTTEERYRAHVTCPGNYLAPTALRFPIQEVSYLSGKWMVVGYLEIYGWLLLLYDKCTHDVLVALWRWAWSNLRGSRSAVGCSDNWYVFRLNYVLSRHNINVNPRRKKIRRRMYSSVPTVVLLRRCAFYQNF